MQLYLFTKWSHLFAEMVNRRSLIKTDSYYGLSGRESNEILAAENHEDDC